MKQSIVKGMTATALLVGGGMVGSSVVKADTQASIQANGWNITYPSGITLTLVPGSLSTPAFTESVTMDSDEGAIISFNQIAADASPTITLQSAGMTNQTGSGWTSMQFILANPSGLTSANQFDSAGIFSLISPFTTTAFSTQMVTFSDGVLPDGNTITFSDAGLTIDASPASGQDDFAIEETPVDGPATTIPLPNGIWSGLSILAGLMVVIPLMRRKRKHRGFSGRASYRTSEGRGRIWPV